MNIPRYKHDDISEIHQEIAGYTRCERVDFETPIPAVNDENETIDTDIAESVIRELGLPSGTLIDWRSDTELWLRYNDEVRGHLRTFEAGLLAHDIITMVLEIPGVAGAVLEDAMRKNLPHDEGTLDQIAIDVIYNKIKWIDPK